MERQLRDAYTLLRENHGGEVAGIPKHKGMAGQV